MSSYNKVGVKKKLLFRYNSYEFKFCFYGFGNYDILKIEQSIIFISAPDQLTFKNVEHIEGAS